MVTRVSGPTATLLADGEPREARVQPRLPGGPLAPGDRVLVRGEGDEALVVGIAPRRTELLRGDGWERRPRVVVANADLLLVVASAVSPPLRPRLIDRYLVAGAAGGLECAIVLTKTDLPHEATTVQAVMDIYREDAGFAVVAGSAKSTELASQVRGLVGHRLAALAGQSGVGKSTLASRLTGIPRATGAVSERIGTGRHTTTDPRVLPIPGGGAVVDTAGVRTFHLSRMDPTTVAAGFPEIQRAAADCRFRSCTHRGEAGCAVPGRVREERLESYRRLLEPMVASRA